MVFTTPFALAALFWSRGIAQQFVQYTPTIDDTSVERIDPIIAPGTISQHVHQVFGSNGLKPLLTYDELQTATCTTVGDAEGNGNADDLSNYWHPALYMELKDGSGYKRVPTAGHKTYYQNAGTGTPRDPFEFPHGFRMMAGNPFLRAKATNVARQNITQWICHSSTGDNQGTYGGFPTGVSTCDAYPGFNGAIHFPHCWNGKDYDAADPTSHVVYPLDDISEGTCPTSHPIRLPHIFIENQFDLDSVADLVKPDSFVLAQGDPTGYGWHADFFNGWVDGAIPELMSTCPQGTYGNEDIGLCPSFNASKISNGNCSLPRYYTEKVNRPGQYLPGCNPVDTTSPAPDYVIAPQGTYTNVCAVVGSSSSSTTEVSAASPTTTKKAHSTKSTTAATSTASSGSETATGDRVVVKGALSCPADDGKLHDASNGKSFVIQCGADHSGGNLSMVYVDSLEECANKCATTAGCIDVSLSGTACYLKSELGERIADSAVNGAKLVSKTAARDLRVHRHRRAHGH